MRRHLLCMALLLLSSPRLLGQEAESVFLTLSPQAPPTPSLKYRLLPDEHDLVPGNAATLYYRSGAMFLEGQAILKELSMEYWDKWATMPLSELPREEVAQKVGWYRNILHEVELATLRRDCDWQISDRPEGIGLLLPEVQGFRNYARLLAVRARLAIAERRFDDAIRDVRIALALGRHLSEGPSLIHVLVGAAICSVLINPLEELVQQPGAPNLYWSLAVLPRPFLGIEPALREERTLFERLWPGVDRLPETPMSPAAVAALKQDLRKKLESFNVVPPGSAQMALQAWWETATYPEAKRSLLARGLPAEHVEAMPRFQAVALYAWREHRRTWEELEKWLHLPDGWRQEGYVRASKDYGEALRRLDMLYFHGLLRGLGGSYTTAFQKVFLARGRVERRLEGVRCLEAIRLYAAAHDGKLPRSLKDVTEIPVPVDPMTHKPFEYQTHGEKASLASPPLPDKGAYDRPVIYVLEMRRPEK
jgi:hypothetical protein